LKDGREAWQRAYESEIGTTVQNDFETVTKNFVVDYLSVANRDVMVIEDGSWVTRYVYDAQGFRISAEFSYAEGTARGEGGENFASDIAVGNVKKVWYRTTYLGSSVIAVDAKGEVLSHMVYDPWGNPASATYPDANYSGIDNRSNFTGYSWDEVLGLYYAQMRLYDAENHRFVSVDPQKDGSNWYVYCGNDGVNCTDVTGLVTRYDYIVIDENPEKLKDQSKTQYGYILIDELVEILLKYNIQAYVYKLSKTSMSGTINKVKYEIKYDDLKVVSGSTTGNRYGNGKVKYDDGEIKGYFAVIYCEAANPKNMYVHLKHLMDLVGLSGVKGVKDRVRWATDDDILVDSIGLKSLDEYVNRYYSGQVTVTFAVATPVPNSRQAIDDDYSGDVGHTFVRIDYGDGRVIYKGFYPANPLSESEILQQSDVPGVIRDDSSHPWDIAKTYVITAENADKIIAFIENYDKD